MSNFLRRAKRKKETAQLKPDDFFTWFKWKLGVDVNFKKQIHKIVYDNEMEAKLVGKK